MTIQLLTSDHVYMRPGWEVLHWTDRLASDPTKNLHTDTGVPKYPSTTFAADFLGQDRGVPFCMLDREDDAKANLWSDDLVVRDAAIAEFKRLLTACRKVEPSMLFGYYDVPQCQDFDHGNPDHVDTIYRKSFAMLPLIKSSDDIYASLYAPSMLFKTDHPIFWITRILRPLVEVTGKRLTLLLSDRSNEDFNRHDAYPALVSAYIRACVQHMPRNARLGYWNEHRHREHPDPEAASIATMKLFEEAVA